MGFIAAETLIARIANPAAQRPREITVEPELIARESTGPAPK
jgi:DNA-binding LacI/PurR family transcriptional regulator